MNVTREFSHTTKRRHKSNDVTCRKQRHSQSCVHVEAKRCTVGNLPDVETRIGKCEANCTTSRLVSMRTREKNAEGEMTPDERITHQRTRHAKYDPKCETCLEVQGVTTHPRKAVAEAAYFDYATVKNSQQSAEVKILVGAGPRGESLREPCIVKEQKTEDLELFLKVLQTRYGHP